MPYVERTVIAGRVRETRKMYTGRIHTYGVSRCGSRGTTSERQARINGRRALENLRWRLNANFKKGDIHVALHYYDKAVNLIEAEQDKRRFLKLLRAECRRLGLEWRYVACTETKSMTNIHHHVVMAPVQKEVLETLWRKATGERGAAVSLRAIDGRGNHGRLAAYLMKESDATALRYKKWKKRYKRFSCSQGMVMPQPSYTIIDSAGWSDEPSPHRGYMLIKDDNGQTARFGINEISGWPWQEYSELWVGYFGKDSALGQNAEMAVAWQFGR